MGHHAFRHCERYWTNFPVRPVEPNAWVDDHAARNDRPGRCGPRAGQLNQKRPPFGRNRGLKDWGLAVLVEGKHRAFVVRTLGLSHSEHNSFVVLGLLMRAVPKEPALVGGRVADAYGLGIGRAKMPQLIFLDQMPLSTETIPAMRGIGADLDAHPLAALELDLDPCGARLVERNRNGQRTRVSHPPQCGGSGGRCPRVENALPWIQLAWIARQRMR